VVALAPAFSITNLPVGLSGTSFSRRSHYFLFASMEGSWQLHIRDAGINARNRVTWNPTSKLISVTYHTMIAT